LALFPEVVGRLAVDGIVRLWGGEDLGEAIHTPAALLTTENLQEYYSSGAAGWTLNEAAVDQLEQTRWETSLPVSTGRHISFAIHFRTHEWYQNVAVAMKARADELGVRLSVEDVNEDLRTEITDLRRLIGKLAATYVKDGETVILDAGTPTTSMAHFLDNHRNIHVITNSAAVFQHLQRSPNVRLTLTGGEYHRESGTFLGRGAQLLLRELRADKVFLVASGVSESFGVSCKDAGEADIRRAMIDAAKEVIVLADHTMVGRDSRVRVAGLSAVHTLMTDAGLPSADRFRLNQLGIKVVVAGEVVPN
jgi:DeoR/GlpR family transcriptional regulator of sugar metabolism